MNHKKHKARFGGTVTKLTGADVEKYVSLAGLDNLKALMPPTINLQKNPDILAIALNAAVGNLCNKNGDSITNETAAAIANDFVYKYVNIGHDRSKCVGVICNFGFSDFVTNKLVTAEETKASSEPVNISLVCLLWKGTLSEKALDLIEASADPLSDKYGAVSASWELYFDDYDIAVGKSKNIAECTVYTGAEKEKFEQYLSTANGPGEVDGNFVFRVLNRDGVIGAGIGLVGNPAADVEGLTVIAAEDVPSKKSEDDTEDLEKEDDEDDEEEEDEDMEDTEEDDTEEKTKPKENLSVTNQYTMKYKFLDKIAEAGLQTSLAGEIDSYVKSALETAAQEYQAKLDSAGKNEAEMKQKLEASDKTVADLQVKVKELQDSFAKTQQESADLKAKLEATAKQDAFNSRMAKFDEAYELSAEHRKILASRLNKIQSDDEFTALESEMAILLASINKEKLNADKSKQTSTASTNTNATGNVADALKNASTEVTLTNSSVINDKAKSYSERLNEIFSKDNVKITIK
jgi:hypothetical protein